MTPFKVSCEHCDATFKINDASKIGKRVKCPKCAEPFTIPKPDSDEFDDDELETPAPRPARRGQVKKSASKGRKVDADGPPLIAWVGGGAAAVVLLLGGLWASGMLSSATPPPQAVASQAPANPPPDGAPIAEILNRLPGTAEVVLHLRVKDAIASPFAAGLRTPEFDAQLKSPSPLIPGTTLAGINSITLALSDVTLSLSEQKRLAASGGAPLNPGLTPFPMNPIVVVTLNDPLTPEFLNFPAESAIKHGSATIYRRPDVALPGLPPCLSIVEPKVVVLATEPQLKALLDQSAPSGLASDFSFVDGQAHLMLAICPRTIVQQVERLAAQNVESPQLHRELNLFAAKGGKSMGLSLLLQSDLDAAVTLLATDASKTPDVQAILEAQLSLMQQGLSSPQMTANPLLASLKPIADAIKVAAAGDRVSASTTIPKESLLSFGQAAMGMAGPALLNMGGPAGAPSAGTPQP